MKHQDSKEPKNQYLDRLLDWYDKSLKVDEIDIKKNKKEFIDEITKYKKNQIVNTTFVNDKKLTLWMRIKKTLGIG